MGLFYRVFTIFWKDILTELRTRQIVLSVVVFCLLVMVIFSFALGAASQPDGTAAPGILWTAITFGGVLGFNRLFTLESGRLDGLMLCPVDHAAIYWGKTAGAFVFMMAVAALITPLFLALFNLPLFQPGLGVVIALASLGFSAPGTLFSAVTLNTRMRDMMLPILFLPVVVPVILSAVEATAVLLSGGGLGGALTWLQILIAFDIIYLVASTLVFEFVIEE